VAQVLTMSCHAGTHDARPEPNSASPDPAAH